MALWHVNGPALDDLGTLMGTPRSCSIPVIGVGVGCTPSGQSSFLHQTRAWPTSMGQGEPGPQADRATGQSMWHRWMRSESPEAATAPASWLCPPSAGCGLCWGLGGAHGCSCCYLCPALFTQRHRPQAPGSWAHMPDRSHSAHSRAQSPCILEHYRAEA